MKMLLIQPKVFYRSISFVRAWVLFQILSVTTYLQEKGKDAELLDMEAMNIDYDKLPQIIEERKPNMVEVFPGCLYYYIPHAFNICKVVKSVDPNIVTIGGGANFTAATEYYMRRCSELDFVVRGDAEPISLELMEALEKGEKDFRKIKGLAWREDGKIYLNPPCFIEDMDSLPFPNWGLVNLDKYHFNLFPPQWGKQAALALSRGCPYSCSFCVFPKGEGQNYRYPSVEWAVESLYRLRYKYGRKMLHMYDPIFGLNEEWAENFFKKIIESKLDIHMCIEMRTDQVIRQKHLLPLMKEAGVKTIFMGVESNLKKDEELYGKKAGGESPAGNAEEALSLVKEAGIVRWGCFMIGTPYHTPEDIREIYRFADKLDPEIASFPLVTPLPGTPLYEKLKGEGLILSEDLSSYYLAEPVAKNLYMSREQLYTLYSEIWSAYYSKPERISRRTSSGNEYERWFYQELYGKPLYSGRSSAFGRGVSSAKELGHLSIPAEEEKSLQKWAREVLGVDWE